MPNVAGLVTGVEVDGGVSLPLKILGTRIDKLP